MALVVGPAREARAAYKAVDPDEVAKGQVMYSVRPYVSPTGEQIVAWKRFTDGASSVAVRSRMGGGFGPVDELSIDSNASLPEMAFNQQGEGVAMWAINTTSILAQSALRPPGGPFGAAKAQGLGCDGGISLDVSKDGRLATACRTYSSSAPHYRFAFGVLNAFGHPVVSNFPTAANDDAFIRTKVDWGEDGTAAFVVEQRPSATSREIRVLTRDPGGGVSAQVVKSVANPDSVEFDNVVVLGDGTVAISYSSRSGDTADPPTLHLRPPGEAPRDVALPGERVARLQADASHKLHMMTVTEGGLSATYNVVTATASGTVSAPLAVSMPSANSDVYDFLVRPDGTEIVCVFDISAHAIYVSLRPAGAAAFQAPIKIAQASEIRDPWFALTPEGDVLATWVHQVAADDQRAMVGGLDAGAAPQLTVAKPPAQVVAGTSVRFEASATDSMGVRSITWRFGDGASASGGSVSHSFAQAGRYTVETIATDRAGNSSSQKHVIEVLGAGDRPARLRVNGPKKIKFKRLLGKGVRFRVRANEPVRLLAQLLARPRSARISAAGDLVLAERRLALATAQRAVKLKPAARLLGKRARKLRLKLRFTATDKAGNQTVVTRALKVT